MGNLIKNAGYLDDVTNWSAVGAASLSVDEATLGAPGRAVIKAAGTATGTQGLRSDARPVSAGLAYDCHGGWYASVAGAALAVEWLNGSNSVVATTELPTIRDPEAAAQRGLPTTFIAAYSRVTAPVGASLARIMLSATFGGSTAYIMALLKPFIGLPSAAPNRLAWDPGASDNADLAIDAWPHDLPPVLWDGYGAAPTPTRKSFAADTGIPLTSKRGAEARAQMKGGLRLSAVQVEALLQFSRTGSSPFWFVRPDTDELCLAEWLEDGLPSLQAPAPGGGGYYNIGLLLAVA